MSPPFELINLDETSLGQLEEAWNTNEFKQYNKNNNTKSSKEKSVIVWDKEEVDYGNFHPYLQWSPKNDMIVYAKYH